MFIVSTSDQKFALKLSATDEFNARQEFRRFALQFYNIAVMDMKALIVTPAPPRK